MPVAFSNIGLGLLQLLFGFRSSRFPILPASQVFLKHEPGPPIVAVGIEHAPVKFIQIRSGHGGRQRGTRNRNQALTESFALYNQGGGLGGFPTVY